MAFLTKYYGSLNNPLQANIFARDCNKSAEFSAYGIDDFPKNVLEYNNRLITKQVLDQQ